MAFLVSYTLVAPLFGKLADSVSRWWLVGIGVILWSLASGASGLARETAILSGSVIISGYAALFITRCFVGVGEGAYGPIAPTVISDLYPVRCARSSARVVLCRHPGGQCSGLWIRRSNRIDARMALGLLPSDAPGDLARVVVLFHARAAPGSSGCRSSSRETAHTPG